VLCVYAPPRARSGARRLGSVHRDIEIVFAYVVLVLVYFSNNCISMMSYYMIIIRLSYIYYILNLFNNYYNKSYDTCRIRTRILIIILMNPGYFNANP